MPELISNSGTIDGTTQFGVYLQNGGSIINSGTILSPNSIPLTNAYSVLVNNGGYLSNSSSGYIGSGGVEFFNGSGTVVNDGRIVQTAAGYKGVLLGGGGSVSNLAAGSIAGAFVGVYIENAVGTVTNAGTIRGATGAGVELYSGGTVIDSGTISGGNGTAISFGGTVANRLVLDPGYDLGGIVVGSTSAGATNTLELGSAASAGTVTAAISHRGLPISARSPSMAARNGR